MVKAAAKKNMLPGFNYGPSYGPGDLPVLFVPGFTTQQYGSAWVAHNGESTIVVTMMGRQDLQTAWSVTYVEMDGDTKSEYGLSKRGGNPIKKVNKVLRKLARPYFPRETKSVEVDDDRLAYGIRPD